MKVSELADKFGVQATELVADLEKYGLPNLGPADTIPEDELKQVRSFLSEKGYKEAASGRKVTLIKKKKTTAKESDKEKKAVAHVKKKIIIKRKHVHVVKPDGKTRDRGPGVRGKDGVIPPGAAPAVTSDKKPVPAGRSKDKGRRHGRREKSQPREKELILKRRPSSKMEQALEAVPDKIEIMEVITVGELARKMNLKANMVIAKLMQLGVMVTINQQIDADTATLVASEFGCEVKTISLYEETVIEETKDKEGELISRPPIVTVMGHVDHGKTKLLDAIRSTDVVATESGGITQHIGAYQVTIPQGKVTFLDTPGHEAFTMMRARGAEVTDIVILVVAADDGIMPQTVEAIDHARVANVPIIVAVNKIDKPEANLDRVKQQLADKDLLSEDWGGSVMCVPVSALKKTGINELLEAILLQAEMLELKANPEKEGVGTILEAKVDPGKGTVATILCQTGSIRVGDSYVAGIYSGKVRAMFDHRGERIDVAGPAMPVEILGLTGLPDAGDPFHVVRSEKRAKTIASKRQELKRFEDAKNVKKVTMENLFEKIQAGEMKELKVVIKADVQGSAEALRDSLEKIENEEVRLVCIHNSAGAINERDVMLASAVEALVIGFHVRPTSKAKDVAEKEKVEIRTYNVIYDAINDVKAAITGMMAPEFQETIAGAAEVREVFKVPKIGNIAGCYVNEGVIARTHKVRVIRDGIEVYDGRISSLKRFKDDTKEVQKGFECGIGIENFNDIKVGDVFEAYFMKEIFQTKE